MKFKSENSNFFVLTHVNNSLAEIAKWTFCFFRISGEKLKSEIEKLFGIETGKCRNNIIFGYFKFC